MVKQLTSGQPAGGALGPTHRLSLSPSKGILLAFFRLMWRHQDHYRYFTYKGKKRLNDNSASVFEVKINSPSLPSPNPSCSQAGGKLLLATQITEHILFSFLHFNLTFKVLRNLRPIIPPFLVPILYLFALASSRFSFFSFIAPVEECEKWRLPPR